MCLRASVVVNSHYKFNVCDPVVGDGFLSACLSTCVLHFLVTDTDAHMYCCVRRGILAVCVCVRVCACMFVFLAAEEERRGCAIARII